MSSILALTLHPEWAWAITHLGKDVENRTEHGHVDQAQVVWQADGKWAEWPDDDSIPDDAVIDILTDAFTRYLDGDLHMVEVPNG